MQSTHPVQNAADAAVALSATPGTRFSAVAEYVLRREVLIRIVLYLTFLVYLRAVFFDYAYDDQPLIVTNPWMASWKGVGMFFTRSFWAFLEVPRAADYYRPLVMTLFAAVRHTVGPAPAWFHLAAIGVHLVAVYLTYRLAGELTGDGTLAAIAAALFGLHPTKLESVAWISGVSDSLCVVFILACMVTYLRWKKAGVRSQVPWTALLWLLLAMLSKEVAVVVPVLVGLYEVLTDERPWLNRVQSATRVVLPYVAVVAAVLAWRAYVLRDFAGANGFTFHYLYSLYTAPRSLAWYLGKQLWPFPISIQYALLVVKHPSFLGFVVPLAGVLAAGAALAALLRQSAAGWLLTAWFVLTLAPVLVFGATLQLHDRHMYAPSVASSIALAYVIVTWVRRYTRSGFPLRSVVVALLCLGSAAATFHNLRYWSDDLTLFNRAIVIGKDHPGSYAPLVAAYFNANDLANAERVSRLWIQNVDEPTDGWASLGEVRRRRKDYAGAREAFLKAVTCSTPYHRTFGETALARLAQAQGQPAEAAYWFGRAVAGRPEAATLHEFYGRALIDAGKPAEGSREIEIARRMRQKIGY